MTISDGIQDGVDKFKMPLLLEVYEGTENNMWIAAVRISDIIIHGMYNRISIKAYRGE